MYHNPSDDEVLEMVGNLIDFAVLELDMVLSEAQAQAVVDRLGGRLLDGQPGAEEAQAIIEAGLRGMQKAAELPGIGPS